MASSKHWALYASKHRLGRRSEHHLAGARLLQFGVMLNWQVPRGWQATIHAYRYWIKFGVQPRQGDVRQGEWFRWVFAQERRADSAAPAKDPE